MVNIFKNIFSGFYMFAQAVGRNAGARAWLYSQYFGPTQATCLSFWYFMYGTGKKRITYFTVLRTSATVKEQCSLKNAKCINKNLQTEVGSAVVQW